MAAIASVWAVAALAYDVRVRWLNIAAACLYAMLVIGILWSSRASRKGILVWLGTLVLVIGWWFSLAPSHDRDWQPDVAQLPWAERQGELVTIHNVRNFSYRTETDYVQKWETRTVDLSQIRGVDLFHTHFGSEWIAHATVSFQFRDKAGNDSYLATSIEQRKTVGQTYSSVRGFFRQYELIYLILDERDVVRLRTNYRSGEDVRLYHTLTTPADARRLFLQYLDWINTIRDHPRWYNALTENCTTSITSYLARSRIGGFPRWDWRFLLNGHGDELLYENGYLATGGMSFPDLAKQALINDAAKKLGDDPEFSKKIRQGHPGFE
jgi:hypothetical protein